MVSSYEIFRDDGANGAFSTSVDSANVANKPYLFEYTFTLPGTLTGKIVRFKL